MFSYKRTAFLKQIVGLLFLLQMSIFPALAGQYSIKVIANKSSSNSTSVLQNISEEIFRGALQVQTSLGPQELPLKLEFVEDGAYLRGNVAPEFQIFSGNEVVVAIAFSQTAQSSIPSRSQILEVVGTWLENVNQERRFETKVNQINERSTEAKFSQINERSAHIGFLSTGSNASGVPLQTPDSFLKIKKRLEGGWKVSTDSISVLFGAGPNSNEANTQSFDLTSNRVTLIKFNGLNEKDAFKLNNLKYLSQYADQLEVKVKLWVLGGHANKNFVPSWGEQQISKEQFSQAINTSSAKNILVSGTCYGATFSSTVAAGFFEASPYTTAGACSERPDQIPMHTYLVDFFAAADNISEADIDRDGKVSLIEAHWYASRYAFWDVTYTKIDALAEENFIEQSKQQRVPVMLSVADYVEYINQFADIGETSFNADIMKSILKNKINTISTGIGGEDQYTEIGVTKLKASQMLRRMLLKEYCERNPESNTAKRVREVSKIERESLKSLFSRMG